VRIGPNEVSFSSPDAVKEIYSQQTDFMKSGFYDAIAKPVPGIFSMRNKAEHGQRRRLLSHAFSQSNLLNTEPLIRQQIQKLVTRVDGAGGATLDMLLLFRLLAFDIIGW
jgi:cytochrome P450